MRTLTRLRRLTRQSRIRLGKRVTNVPVQLAKQVNSQPDIGDYESVLHPTKGWRHNRK